MVLHVQQGGAMAASKGFMGKTVMGKLAAPFVTKAAGAGAAVGAGAAGGAVAGPLGGSILCICASFKCIFVPI